MLRTIGMLWLLPKFRRQSILKIYCEFQYLLFNGIEGKPSKPSGLIYLKLSNEDFIVRSQIVHHTIGYGVKLLHTCVAVD